MTPEQFAAFQAWQQQQAAMALQQAMQPPQPVYAPPPQAPAPQMQYAPPPPPPQQQYAPQYAPPPGGYQMPQGAQPPVQGQTADDDMVHNLPPADLPAEVYDFEVLYVDTKTGESDKGLWEKLRFRLTVLAGPLMGQSILFGVFVSAGSNVRPLYNLAEACGRPIVKTAQGGISFSKRSLNGCKVTGEVFYRSDFSDVKNFKPLQVQGQVQPPQQYAPPPQYGQR
jgi:hypothetical protein